MPEEFYVDGHAVRVTLVGTKGFEHSFTSWVVPMKDALDVEGRATLRTLAARDLEEDDYRRVAEASVNALRSGQDFCRRNGRKLDMYKGFEVRLIEQRSRRKDGALRWYQRLSFNLV